MDLYYGFRRLVLRFLIVLLNVVVLLQNTINLTLTQLFMSWDIEEESRLWIVIS